MNARGHFATAEQLLKSVDEASADYSSGEMAWVQARLTRANVHALLAQAASTNPAVIQPDPVIPPEPPVGRKVSDCDGDIWVRTDDRWHLLDPGGDPALVRADYLEFPPTSRASREPGHRGR